MYLDASAESLWQSRELLMNSKFDELEARIIKSDKALAESKDGAVLYYDFVYRSMINTNDLIDSSTLLSQLHKWREARPKSYAPLAALGLFHHRYGGKLRGDKWRSETTDEQISGMRREYRKAIEYSKKSIAINNSAMRPFETILGTRPSGFNKRQSSESEDNVVLQLLCNKSFPRLSKSMGCKLPESNFTEMEIFKRADPSILKARILWVTFLFNNTPRWGGSYNRMHRIIDEAKKHLYEQELYYLGAIEVSDRMDRLRRDKNYQQALDMGREYLAIGEKADRPFYKHEATIYFEMMKSAKHLDLFDDCIKYGLMGSKIYSWNSRSWADIGYCATHAKDWELANFTLKYHASTWSEVDAWALFYLGESFRNLRQFDITYTLFKRANRADAEYVQFTKDAILWIEKNHPKQAVELDKSVEEIVGQLTVDDLMLQLSAEF